MLTNKDKKYLIESVLENLEEVGLWQNVKDGAKAGIKKIDDFATKVGSKAHNELSKGAIIPSDIAKLEADYDIDSKVYPKVGKIGGGLAGALGGASIGGNIADSITAYEEELKDQMYEQLAKCGSNEVCIKATKDKYNKKLNNWKSKLFRVLGIAAGTAGGAVVGGVGGYKLGDVVGRNLAKGKTMANAARLGKKYEYMSGDNSYIDLRTRIKNLEKKITDK